MVYIVYEAFDGAKIAFFLQWCSDNIGQKRTIL